MRENIHIERQTDGVVMTLRRRSYLAAMVMFVIMSGYAAAGVAGFVSGELGAGGFLYYLAWAVPPFAAVVHFASVERLRLEAQQLIWQRRFAGWAYRHRKLDTRSAKLGLAQDEVNRDAMTGLDSATGAEVLAVSDGQTNVKIGDGFGLDSAEIGLLRAELTKFLQETNKGGVGA